MFPKVRMFLIKKIEQRYYKYIRNKYVFVNNFLIFKCLII